MANAIKQISVQRGHDVTRFALCCFGGAGGQHAAQVADALGIRRVIIHPLAGVLSAYGIGVADVRVLRRPASKRRSTTSSPRRSRPAFEPLAAEALAALREQGADAARCVELEHRLLVKVAGADTALPVAWQRGSRAAELRASSVRCTSATSAFAWRATPRSSSNRSSSRPWCRAATKRRRPLAAACRGPPRA